MKKLTLTLLASASLLGSLPTRAHAAFVFTLQQVGADVVVNGSGTLDTTALTLATTDHYDVSQIYSTGAFLLTAGAQADQSVYNGGGLTGPGNFGTGGSVITTQPESGDLVGIYGGANLLFTPVGYVSGSALTSSATFSNMTLASLGYTPGTYTYTWGTGATADSLTVTSVVPEPGTWTLLGAGTGLLALAALRQRRPRGA